MRLALGVRRPRRHVLGLYFAGVIDAVGTDVEGFEVGDEVYGTTGLRLGSYGEHLVLPAKAIIAPKPTSMTFAEAAALPLGASNALDGLRCAEVGSGDRVLVNGAGGVIGAYGVQIARMLGGEVTGVDAAYKESFVRSMGAIDFVDYRSTDVTTLDDRFDVIFDMVPSSRVSRMLDLLEPDGRYVSGNPRLSTMLRASRLPFTDERVHVATAGESRAAFAELAAMVDAGQLVGIVDRVLPMEQAAEAHRLVETEQRLGAIVLAIGPDAEQRRAAAST
ncbi:MAG: NAD(P)-dependent alcohol dehydrogenase, partial [Ilumatobacter sp.]|nr:NAD(P)-dependent alcohol dehydrogenase [Ilumatobacter sp.]